MTTFSVSADASAAGALAAMASLPLSYTPAAASAAPEVRVLDGQGDWPRATAAALTAGSAVIIVHPQPAATDTISGDGLVVLDSMWASNPAVAAGADHFHRAAVSAGLVECRLTTGSDRSLAASLTDTGALLRQLVGPLTSIQLIHHDPHGFVAVGETAQLEVQVSVTVSTARAPHAYVRLLTDDGGIEIAIPHPSIARPAEIVITDPHGIRTLPTIWESGHRATWRRAHQLLRDHSTCSDLEAFTADQATLSTALQILQR